jgi:NAD(P)H-dependent FMN reductase
MKNIVALAASNSHKSINKQLATWAAAQIDDVQVKILDLNDFEMPIYSMEREREGGVPIQARKFKDAINDADGIIISFAEHNGSYSTAFKNLFDWMSRLEKPIWSNKPMLLLATSPGPRGASGVLSTATNSFPFQGGKVAGSFSLPSFSSNFNRPDGITNFALRRSFMNHLRRFETEIHPTHLEVHSKVGS